MKKPKGQRVVIEFAPVTDLVVEGMACAAVESLKKVFAEDAGRKKFEEWYREKYGKEYHWVTLKEIHEGSALN